MELYMLNRQHGRMILESVENGPLLWPKVEEKGVTRPKKYSELSATEAIQADCDVKENQEKDKIRSKPDKNRKRVEAEKSLEQLQWVEEEKLSKTQKEWPKTQTRSKAIQV
nr:hypothetical protein [Tanacetum cinerariifolium]